LYDSFKNKLLECFFRRRHCKRVDIIMYMGSLADAASDGGDSLQRMVSPALIWSVTKRIYTSSLNLFTGGERFAGVD
jgi:hypothetical protein